MVETNNYQVARGNATYMMAQLEGLILQCRYVKASLNHFAFVALFNANYILPV